MQSSGLAGVLVTVGKMDKQSNPPVIEGIDLSVALTWSRHQQFAAYSGQVITAHRYIEDWMDVLIRDYRLHVSRKGKPTSKPTFNEKRERLEQHFQEESRVGKWVWTAVQLLNTCRNVMTHGVSPSDALTSGFAREQLERYIEYVKKCGPDVVEPAVDVPPAGKFNQVTDVLAISIQQLAITKRRAVLLSGGQHHQREALRDLFD